MLRYSDGIAHGADMEHHCADMPAGIHDTWISADGIEAAAVWPHFRARFRDLLGVRVISRMEGRPMGYCAHNSGRNLCFRLWNNQLLGLLGVWRTSTKRLILR